MRRILALLAAGIVSILTASACSKSPPPDDEIAAVGPEEKLPEAKAPDEALGKIAAADAPTTLEEKSDAAAPLTGSASCPGNMVLVEGEYCTEVRQDCLEWMDRPDGNLPQHRCAKFAPSKCIGERVHKRFCIDKDEYAKEGESLPQGDTSWTDAVKTCKGEGKRLCNESEWQFACEGEEMRPYPYGYERDSTKCNFDRDDLVDSKGNLADHRKSPDELAECLSPFGVRNMTGNIDEWTFREGQVWKPFRSALKGGWWLAGRNRCRPATTAHDEYFHEGQTGFRCCSDAN